MNVNQNKQTLLLVVILFLLPSVSLAKEKIISVSSQKIDIFSQAFKGFKKCYKQGGGQLDIIDLTLPRKSSDIDQFVKRVKTLRPVLVLAIGDVAAKYMMALYPQIPLVYCMVVDPSKNNLPNSGIAATMNPKKQIEFIRHSFPSLRRVGVFYSKDRNMRDIAQCREMIKNGDKNVILIPVSSFSEVEKSLPSVRHRVDCLLMLPNAKIYSIKMLNNFFINTIQMKIPVFSFSPALVQAGCLGGFYSDPAESGCSVSHYAISLLAGESQEKMVMQWPQKTRYALNKVIAKRLGLVIPSQTMKKADLVVK